MRYVVLVGAVSTAVAAVEYTAVMDLSYKPHVSAAKMSNAIRDSITGKPPSAVELDVSFSELGNEGIACVIQSLLNATETSPLELLLKSRMNRLSPAGVAAMLNSLLGDDESKTQDEEASPNSQPSLVLQSLDLGWNNLGPGQTGSKEFLASLRKLIETPDQCPSVLRFYRCGLGPASCRAIGKALMKRSKLGVAPPIRLHLCGNEAIGDAGTVALVAAIRSCKNGTVLDELDFSSCNVGNAGAEALALAFKGVKSLDLSNNKVSDDGASVIGRSLLDSDCCCNCIDLSNNHDIGDTGAADIAAALEHGAIRSLSMRSCQVHADGAKAFGESLVGLSKRTNQGIATVVDIDLSGNPLGVLRGKKKTEGNKYSAIKSKASATTVSYMNFIGKKIRSGLKEVGWDTGKSAYSVDSDDDEEDSTGDSQDKHAEASKARCGAKAFASAIVVGDHEKGPDIQECRIKCKLAVRHCFLDRGGADALAATVLQAKQRLGVDLVIDARMNPVLEEDMIEALRGGDPDVLEEMAERHMSVLETLRIAEERAVEAAAAAASRRREEAEWESDNDGLELDRPGKDEDEYDSDARYDDEYDEENFY